MDRAFANNLTGYRPDRSGANRPGTVLIMVVAMLSMLFIVGAAFLVSVTFESAAIKRTTRGQRRSAVVDRLSREVRTELKRAFLGDDGKPWNRDKASLIGNDSFGEVMGVHPLIASLEPYSPDPGVENPMYFWYQASDLELVLKGKSLQGAVDNGGAIQDGTNLVRVDSVYDELPGLPFDPNPNDPDKWTETIEGNTVLVGPTGTLKLYRRDADGDGVWDSYEYRLPEDRYPASMRGDLAEQIRQKDFDPQDVGMDPADPNADPKAIFYALRVIPHGAMVDVGHAHKTLLDQVLADEAGNVEGPYVSEGEEVILRRRFLLPPRDVVLSALQNPMKTADSIPLTLYYPFRREGPTDNRWWPIVTGENGDDTTEIESHWLPWIDPFSDSNFYDFRHLVTTVSHDDQLMRMGRDPPPAPDADWIEAILAGEKAFASPGNFSIDEWPEPDPDLTDDEVPPLTGRLKVSLPGVVKEVLLDSRDPLFDFDTNPTYDGRAIDALSDPALGPPVRKRFIRTIQDAFLLMLRNITDADTLAILDIPKTAAALTANLIDFADSDGDDTVPGVPTRVEIRNEGDGVGTGKYVYGLEAQPFITEIYADASAVPGPLYAVELYNPFDVRIDLDAYKLVDEGSGYSDQLDGQLNGNLDPKGYVVFKSGTGSGLDSATSLGDWDLVTGSVVELRRTADIPFPDNEIVVDRFEAAAGFGSPAGRSLQRVTDNTVETGGWTALVPVTQQAAVDAMDGGKGTDNPATGSIRPVQVGFANTGDMRTAFPTTGALLLLSRYANSVDEPFTAKLVEDSAQIDNGRMPIFDPDKLAQAAAAGPLALSVPWGQLVFDYFTALPLDHDYNPIAVLPADMTPTIDQGGLRVHGRIDLNSAPWMVLAGLPLVPKSAFDGYPADLKFKIENTAKLQDDPVPIGDELAQSIVAYRERRQVSDPSVMTDTANFATARLRKDDAGNPLTGFLTVGELANVRSQPDGSNAGTDRTRFDFDAGVIDDSNPANQDYIKAVAKLVALGDWVTTRSHVFTVYGTLRGSGTKSAVDQKAIRFQETVDRLPSFFDNRLPRRIGPRVVGPYAQASRN